VSEHARFVAPARLIALLTACSRVLGVLREVAFSYFLGTAPVFSSFCVAFLVPNLARRLFGEGAMASAFIPIFTEVLRSRGRARAAELAGAAFTLLGGGLIVLTILIEGGMLAAHLARPSFTLTLAMIMLPYMILICLTGFAGGMLNALDRFAAPAAAPILLNIVLIGVLLIGGRFAGLRGEKLLYAVAAGVVLAGVAQFGAQVLDARRAGFRPRLNCNWRDPDLRRILVMMGPMLIGVSALQFNVLADKLIALAFVPEGRGPAVLNYAHMLYHLPQGVFGIALATAIFPLFSTRAAEGDRAGLARALESGVRVCVFIALPAAAGLILLATPVVALLYQHRGGAFDEVATGHVSRTLVFYCLGLVAFSAQPILTRAAYAMQDVRGPVRIGLVTVGLNLVLSFVLVFPLAEGGIALATALAAWLQVVWLAGHLTRSLPGLSWRRVGVGVGRMGLAVAAMCVFVGWVARWSPLSNARPVAQLAAGIPGGILVFAGMARLIGCGELRELLSRDRRASGSAPA